MKKALIFGVTGQDGAYLSKFLLNKKNILFTVLKGEVQVLTQIELTTYTKIHMLREIFIYIMVILVILYLF